jgi:hypothetical protein
MPRGLSGTAAPPQHPRCRTTGGACLSAGVDCALLYAANLTRGFFDLSSGEAGVILQKLRNYRIRMAVVCVPGTAQLRSRFGDCSPKSDRTSSNCSGLARWHWHG